MIPVHRTPEDAREYARMQAAIKRVHSWGYMRVVRGVWTPTEKGWRMIIASAEPPMPKPPSQRKQIIPIG